MFARSLARLAWLATATASLAVAWAGAATAQGITCEKCHGNRDFLVGKGGPRRDSALYVPAGILQDTRHAGLRHGQR